MTVPADTVIDDASRILRGDLERVEAKLTNVDGLGLTPLEGLLGLMFASGGKRIRPALALASSRLGECDLEAATNLGAAVETLHAATLVHDDLVDGSTLRRGLPTVNAHWSASATVLAGDWLFARAARFAAATDSVRVMDIFARTLQTLTNGELRQLFGRSKAPSRDEYEARIYSKTAALFEASCEMGGVLAQASQATLESLGSFGREMGMAFQIVDDILDFAGTAERLGKPVGSDVRSGTFTLPALLHVEARGGVWPSLSTETEREDFAATVAMDEEALEGARQEAEDRLRRAHMALHALPAGEARELLSGLARHVVDRDA